MRALSCLLYAQDGNGLIHVVLARAVHALAADAGPEQVLRMPIADLESGRFNPSAPDGSNLKAVIRHSAVPVKELTKTIVQLWDQPGVTCSWPSAVTPTSKR